MPMGQHGTLGRPHGSGGVDNRGEVVRIELLHPLRQQRIEMCAPFDKAVKQDNSGMVQCPAQQDEGLQLRNRVQMPDDLCGQSCDQMKRTRLPESLSR